MQSSQQQTVSSVSIVPQKVDIGGVEYVVGSLLGSGLTAVVNKA